MRFKTLSFPAYRTPAVARVLGDLAVTGRRQARLDATGSAAAANAFAVRTLRSLQVEVAVSGLDHIDPTETYLIVATHESLLDPLVLAHLHLPLRFIARADLVDEPIFGRYLTHDTALLVDPERGWKGLRNIVTARAANDPTSLVLFPQGSVLGIETAFQPGVAWIAERLGLPVLPVIITGSHHIWQHPFSARLTWGQAVDLTVLAPIPPDQLDVAELQTAMKSVALGGDARRFEPDRDGWWDGYAYEIDAAFSELKHRVDEHRAMAKS